MGKRRGRGRGEEKEKSREKKGSNLKMLFMFLSMFAKSLQLFLSPEREKGGEGLLTKGESKL